MISRRDFIKTSTMAGAASLVAGYSQAVPAKQVELKKITIRSVNSNFEREPLIRPFGFKGGYTNEIWQSANYLQSSSGY